MPRALNLPSARRALAGGLAALLAGLALGAATGEARPAPELTFRFEGRGYGHGVGMSQFGARGAALAGLGAPAILRHYYRGTRIGTAPSVALRVRIAEQRATLVVGGGSSVRARTLEGRRARLSARTRYRVSVASGVVRVRAPSGRVRLAGSGVRLTPVRAASLYVDGRRYRGVLDLVVVGAGRLDAVNRVSIEHYLAGVLPREVPADWGDRTPAALRAQAIAARSYAYDSRAADGHFDLHADTRSQVYGGADGEDPRTTAAVRATRGKVVTYRGEVITAYYFSTSGGRTENVENVFGGEPRPYLRSVGDPYDATSPYHRRWPDPPRVGARRLGRLLGLGAPVRSFRVAERGRSPRVISARVETADGVVHTVSGADVRAAVGLRDTWFRVVREGRRDR